MFHAIQIHTPLLTIFITIQTDKKGTMTESVSIKELNKRYPDEWVLAEIVEEDDLERPTRVKVLKHSPKRKEIYDALEEFSGRIAVLFTGDVPRKGTVFGF